MAGLAAAPGAVSRREFWLAQGRHQLPMLGGMLVMVVTGDSVFGLLLVVAGLWIIALARASAARGSLAAREFLVDLLAMALIVIIMLTRAAHPSGHAGGMPGMLGASPSWSVLAVTVAAAWSLARVGMARAAGAGAHRAGSLVSGSCCAAGLITMLLM